VRAARAKTVVPLVTAILALAALCMTDTSARAQDAPAACVTGNLKDNYLGQTCTLGNLTVRFDKDFPGASAVDPTKITVTPTTGPSALSFVLPLITPEADGKVSFSFFSSFHGSGAALTGAIASAVLGGKNVKVEVFVSALPKIVEHDLSILELLNFVSSAQGSFAQPGSKAVSVSYHLVIEEAAQPTFTFTLIGG